jgi:hypothetical protein
LQEIESGRVDIQIARWQALHDKRNHPVWVNRARYNLRSLEQWESATTAVDKFLNDSTLHREDGFQEEYTPVDVGHPRAIPRNDSRQSRWLHEARARETQLQEQLKQTRAARDSEAARRRQARSLMRRLKRHLGTYERALSEFRRLVDDMTTTETQVHAFIEENKPFWLFGLEYLDFESKLAFPPSKPRFIFDLMLHRLDGFYDLVELKGPNENLFDRRTPHRSKLNVKLSEAVGQVISYLSACEHHRRKGLFKPKAVIVIGKKKTDDPQMRRLLESHLARVEVLTYTDLVRRGTQLLKHLQGWRD